MTAWPARVMFVTASAVLYATSLSGSAAGVAGWIALVPLLWCLLATSVRGSLACGLLFGVLQTLSCCVSLPSATASYFGIPGWLGVVVFAAVALLTVAPYSAGFCVAARVILRRRSVLTSFLVAAAWVTAEFCRSRMPWSNAWALLGYSQADQTNLVQIANVTGVYGLSFVVCATNALFARIAWTMLDRTNRRMWHEAALVAAVLIGAWAYGATSRSHIDDAAGTAVRVGIVQGNVDAGAQWRASLYGTNLLTYMSLTGGLLRDRSPRLIVWPENAMTFFLAGEPRFRAALGQMLGQSGAQLIAGGPRLDAPGSDTVYNSAFVLDGNAAVTSVYDKQVLLPLAEYRPWLHLPLSRRSFGGVREFTPGGPAQLLATSAGTAGVALCNEVSLPQLAGDRVAAGAEFIVTLANDTWIGDERFAGHSLAVARLRAIEQRRYVVRASTAGPSAIIGPRGEILARTSFGQPAVASASIQPLRSRTVYSRAGDASAFACCVAVAAALLQARRRTRRGP